MANPIQNKTVHPVILCILDGWGIAPASKTTPMDTHGHFFNHLWKKYPHTTLHASQSHVGLPMGQMGNSEVGHMTIGLGRCIEQDLVRINRTLTDLDEFRKLPPIAELIKTSHRVHLIGLLSDGGVHSDQGHLEKIIESLLLTHQSVIFHAFLDGRDTPPGSANFYIDRLHIFLDNFFNRHPDIALSQFMWGTIGGRYYGMDRDMRMDRIEKAYIAFIQGEGAYRFKAPKEVTAHYDRLGISDEFIPPCVHHDYCGMKDGDVLWMGNFRSDRIRQILTALLSVDPNFTAFKQTPVHFSAAFSMTSCSDQLDSVIIPLFDRPKNSNSLGEWVSEHGLSQLRIAETEKYAHVTFFLNGGRETPFPKEERILIPSPAVATYDLCPEMSASKITDALLLAIQNGLHHLIVVNFANADMVGHTGIPSAICLAIEAIDHNLKKIYDACMKRNWSLVITADHGNAEEPTDPVTQGISTSHTCNPVPLIVVQSENNPIELLELPFLTSLSDIAPLILKIMGLPIPSEMIRSLAE